MVLTEEDEKRVQYLLTAYEARRWRYELLAMRVQRFMTWKSKVILAPSASRGLPALHLVQARAKSSASLANNLRNGRYTQPERMIRDGVATEREVPIPLAKIDLAQLRDLAAVRVIIYFKDDVDRLCEQLVTQKQLETWFGAPSLKEFKDKSPSRPESFGYESKHFPVRISKGSDFERIVADDQFEAGMQCEVQLRTVLQHGWAEAEHDLRYKGSTPRTDERERQWALIAALIAGADSMLEDQKEAFIPKKASAGTARQLDVDTKEPTGYVPHGRSDRGPVLDYDRTLYDVDEAMRAAGINAYSKKMRSTLGEREPELLRNLDRDDLIVRVSSWPDGADRVRVQPTLYSDGVITNNVKALEQSVDGTLVRSLALDADGVLVLLPFESSPMANDIGVAMMIKTVAGCWLLSVRGRKVAYEPERLGCSVSGALTWAEVVDSRDDLLVTGGLHCLQREAIEELGFKPAAEEIRYLGAKRELRRAGKPQLFFAASVNLTAEQILACWNVRATDEYEDIDFVDDGEARRVCESSRFRGREASNELREALGLAIAAGG